MKLARCDMQAGFGARPCDVTVPFNRHMSRSRGNAGALSRLSRDMSRDVTRHVTRPDGDHLREALRETFASDIRTGLPSRRNSHVRRRGRMTADARKMTDRQLFRGWRKRAKDDPAFFAIILEEIHRRAKATDFGRHIETSRQALSSNTASMRRLSPFLAPGARWSHARR